jgi:hypothetical protein
VTGGADNGRHGRCAGDGRSRAAAVSVSSSGWRDGGRWRQVRASARRCPGSAGGVPATGGTNDMPGMGGAQEKGKMKPYLYTMLG